MTEPRRRGPDARPRRACALGLFLGLASALAGCGGPKTPEEQRAARARAGKGDLVIAVAWPWELRKEIRFADGLQMAVDEANAQGGVGGRSLRLAKYDDQESVDRGRVIAQEIAGNLDVVAVVGHLQSYMTMAVADVYHGAGLVLLAPTSTDPELTERKRARVFRATFNDRSVGSQLADFAKTRARKVAVYYIRNDYGRNVANAFEARAAQLGLSLAARESYDPSENVTARTFERVVSEWKLLDLDAIVLAGEVPSAATFVAQARAAGIKAPIFGGDAMSSPGLMAVAGPAAEGMIVASFFHPDEPRPEVVAFKEAFAKRYGAEPDAGAALGYDCVRVLAHAMREGKSAVPDDVARFLHAMPPWKGVTATFQFDESGDIVAKPIVMSVVKSARFQYLAPPSSGAGAGRP
jgi:branched-chain amino acid transport system substrate-binding protein